MRFVSSQTGIRPSMVKTKRERCCTGRALPRFDTGTSDGVPAAAPKQCSVSVTPPSNSVTGRPFLSTRKKRSFAPSTFFPLRYVPTSNEP